MNLNSDGPAHDPTQLPEPNHVMLNHLYALADYDNVVVLGATHRYRQVLILIFSKQFVVLFIVSCSVLFSRIIFFSFTIIF